MSVSPTKKKCSKCHRLKPINKFGKTSRKYNGLVYHYLRKDCKACRNKEKRQWDKDHKEDIKIYNSAYYEANANKSRKRYNKRKVLKNVG